jgi:hypothetical protein
MFTRGDKAAEVRKTWIYTANPPYSFHGIVLNYIPVFKYRNNFHGIVLNYIPVFKYRNNFGARGSVVG